MKSDAYIEMANAEDTFWWFVGRRKIISAALSKLKFKNKPAILEIGSGTGGNLAMLSALGHVSAIEINAWAVEFARNDYSPKPEHLSYPFAGRNQVASSVDFIVADFMTYDFKSRKFDLVCAFDVLEHLADDDQALHRMLDLVADEGYLMITVPAYQWLWSQHDQKLHHFRRYHKSALLSKLSKLTVKLHFFSYFNFLLFPLALMSRFWGNLTHQELSSQYDKNNIFLNNLLTKIFSLEEKLLFYIQPPFGLSLIFIIKK